MGFYHGRLDELADWIGAILDFEMAAPKVARRWIIDGRVQGVGYRYFAVRLAQSLGLTGHACNLEDGRVEVYAVGSEEGLRELGGGLRVGPRMADVRGVQEEEAVVEKFEGFTIRG